MVVLEIPYAFTLEVEPAPNTAGLVIAALTTPRPLSCSLPGDVNIFFFTPGATRYKAQGRP